MQAEPLEVSPGERVLPPLRAHRGGLSGEEAGFPSKPVLPPINPTARHLGPGGMLPGIQVWGAHQPMHAYSAVRVWGFVVL